MHKLKVAVLCKDEAAKERLEHLDDQRLKIDVQYICKEQPVQKIPILNSEFDAYIIPALSEVGGFIRENNAPAPVFVAERGDIRHALRLIAHYGMMIAVYVYQKMMTIEALNETYYMTAEPYSQYMFSLSARPESIKISLRQIARDLVYGDSKTDYDLWLSLSGSVPEPFESDAINNRARKDNDSKFLLQADYKLYLWVDRRDLYPLVGAGQLSGDSILQIVKEIEGTMENESEGDST